MTNSYNVGDNRKFTASFTDINGVLTDPSTVTVTVRKPDGTTETPAPNQDSTGVYSINYELTLPGRYIVQFLGDGVINAMHETEVWARHKGAN